jgi:hypothetical protein
VVNLPDALVFGVVRRVCRSVARQGGTSLISSFEYSKYNIYAMHAND